MRLYAPAKINWTLEVLGRSQSDESYHEIRTVLQTIDLTDIIEVTPAQKLSLEVVGAHEISENDLLLVAARMLQEESGYAEGAHICLTKRIPVGAGLGGGSSDAAALLRGLNAMWGLNWERRRLASLAAKVSSDASFFLWGGTALAEGRGEHITPLPDAPPRPLLLIVPPGSLPNKTARMYASLGQSDLSDGYCTQLLLKALHEGKTPNDDLLVNAFERAAYEMWPQLIEYRDILLSAGVRRVHLAGSGPALFVLVSDQEQQRLFLDNLGTLRSAAIPVYTIGAEAAVRIEP